MNLTPVIYSEKEADFMDFWRKGGERVYYAGFECVKHSYGVVLGGCTDLTGFPASGKTEFALEVQFHLSEEYGMRHAVYAPDIGKYEEIRKMLIHKHTGKGMDKRYPHNYIDEATLVKATAWVNHHFIVLKKKDTHKPVHPKDFYDFVAGYKDDAGEIQTGLCDSWKNFFHDMKGYGREDQYLDYILSYRNELAEEAKKHFFTIAHATKTELEDSTRPDGRKKRRIPDTNDIKGGGSWFANGKVIGTVDYPDHTTNGTDLYFGKVKPNCIGKSDAIIGQLYFDWGKSRYYEEAYGEKWYAGQLKKELENREQESIAQLDEDGEQDDKKTWW